MMMSEVYDTNKQSVLWQLTLWRSLLPYGYTRYRDKAFCVGPCKAVICNF